MYPESLEKYIPSGFDLSKYKNTADMHLLDWASNLGKRCGLKIEILDEDLEELTSENIESGAVSTLVGGTLGVNGTVSILREVTCYQVMAIGDDLEEKLGARTLYSTMPKRDFSQRGKNNLLNKFISEINGYHDWLMAEPAWLEIDMSCSDKEIQNSFANWLKNKRLEKFAADEKRKRREYKLKDFSAATLRRWHEARVLAYLDLEAWNYLRGNKITTKIYGDILFPEYKDERDNTAYVNDTVKPLADLLTSQDVLMRMRKVGSETNRQKIS